MINELYGSNSGIWDSDDDIKNQHPLKRGNFYLQDPILEELPSGYGDQDNEEFLSPFLGNYTAFQPEKNEEASPHGSEVKRAKVEPEIPSPKKEVPTTLDKICLQAAENGQIELVENLVTTNPHVEVNSIDGQPSVLLFLAKGGHWNLIARILQLRPNCHINFSYRKVSPLKLASLNCPADILKQMIVHMMNWDTPGVDLHLQLQKLGKNFRALSTERIGQFVKGVFDVFYQVAWAMPDFTKQSLGADGFAIMPKKIQLIISLKALKKIDPHLATLPDSTLENLFDRFQTLVYSQTVGEVVACLILKKVYPIEQRKITKIKARNIRNWIGDQISRSILNGTLAKMSIPEQRNPLVELVTSRYFGLKFDEITEASVKKYFASKVFKTKAL